MEDLRFGCKGWLSYDKMFWEHTDWEKEPSFSHPMVYCLTFLSHCVEAMTLAQGAWILTIGRPILLWHPWNCSRNIREVVLLTLEEWLNLQGSNSAGIIDRNLQNSFTQVSPNFETRSHYLCILIAELHCTQAQWGPEILLLRKLKGSIRCFPSLCVTN